VDEDRDELTGGNSPEPRENWRIENKESLLVHAVDIHGDGIRAVIFAPNGRCVKKIYVTIMEGVNITADPIPVTEEVEEADGEVPDDEDDDEFSFEPAVKHNIRVLEISPFTGKIRFLF